jgi:N-acetylglucosamine kinase-like BadF-type ATPase
VRSDAEAAHERAFGPRGSGILLAAGTGSIALGWTATRGRGRGWDGNGRWERAGGLGPLLGDEGSAFWIGREWLRATSRGTGLLHVRRLSRAPDAVARIAALAPSVLDRARRGDRVARRIVAEAQRHLAALLIETAERLRLLPPVPVSWTGGLLDDARFRAGVWREARRRGLRLRLTPPGNLERRLAALARRTPRTHR